MRYRKLGDSGLQVSVLALGSWLTFGRTVDDHVARSCVDLALDGGVNLIDTADVYHRGEAERVLGEVLASRERRHIVLATKTYFPMSDDVNDRGLSRKHVVGSIDGSLRRLRTDYVDLYQCHRFDPHTPLHELVRTMGDLIARGKIHYWGISYWSAQQIDEVCDVADAMGAPRPISNQPPYSLLDRAIERDVIATSLRRGLGQIVFSPLAQGVLSGKYTAGRTPEGSRASRDQDRRIMGRYLEREVLERVEHLGSVAAEAGLTLAQLALAWVLQREGITSAIFGASRPEQVEENLAAADLDLDDDVIAAATEAVSD